MQREICFGCSFFTLSTSSSRMNEKKQSLLKDFLILIQSEVAQKLDSLEKGQFGIVCN